MSMKYKTLLSILELIVKSLNDNFHHYSNAYISAWLNLFVFILSWFSGYVISIGKQLKNNPPKHKKSKVSFIYYRKH
jgi:uncharacterized membrane protein YbhN (UPF0104 family)